MTTPRDTVLFTTPAGHEVVADLDYESFKLRHAKVVHSYTGVIKPLDDKTAENLARALKAKHVFEQALSERQAVEKILDGFGAAVKALGETHPALAPYWKEAQQHRLIAEDMRARAKYFHDDAMKAIDRWMD